MKHQISLKQFSTTQIPPKTVYFGSRAQKNALPLFHTTNISSSGKNVLFRHTTTLSRHAQQRNGEPMFTDTLPSQTHFSHLSSMPALPSPPLIISLQSPTFFSIVLTARYCTITPSRAINAFTLIKIEYSVGFLAQNMPNIPLGQQFLQKMSLWRFPQRRPIDNQGITAVIIVPPNVQAVNA